MQLGTQEHYDIMTEFEKQFKHKPDRETKNYWPGGNIYCNGEINEKFKSFCLGYALAKCIYQVGNQ